ncbi:MAG: tRNA (guanosine(37)-N1)-methyltransferase TrmD [candidate division Zixibacteria bacterium]|nr:tRNA (guanosine(37)-N1)-methyltransferase TrmD [candidate division Zixibacteria bacterium]
MKIEIVTLFPDYFNLSLKQSLLGKAIDKRLFDIEIINLRDYSVDKHHTVDDTPFGGGGGMVLKVEPVDRCLTALGYSHRDDDSTNSDKEKIILTTAAGKRFDQPQAIRYSLCERLTIICGHYLGVDERLSLLYDLNEISIGDYVLSGGEPAALVIVDAVARLIPGVMGNFESALEDSHMNSTLGTPCYTKPSVYKGFDVPAELISGNHKEIKRFRQREALRKCLVNRPDILAKAELSDEEEIELEHLKQTDNKKKKTKKSEGINSK